MHRWWPLVAVSLTTFMLILDLTIVIVAVPAIGHDLDASSVQLQWIVDMYSLALAALLLGTGALGDRIGHRTLFLAGGAVFGLASLGCALAPGADGLVIARAVQALGGAALMTTGSALVSNAYRGRERAVAFGVWAGAASLASAVGPVVGGVITQLWGWRWIFAVNVPVMVIGLVVAVTTVAHRPGHRGGRFDLPGVVTFGLAVSALVFGLIHSTEHGWAAPASWGSLATAVLMLAGFVVVERRSAHPVLDLHLFTGPSFRALIAAGAITNATAFGMLPFVSIWLQTVLHLEPIPAGLMLMPLALACLVASLATPKLVRRAGARAMIGSGLAVLAVGAALMTLIAPGSTGWAAAPGLALIGLGCGFVLPALVSATLAAAPAERAGMAGAVLASARTIGYAVGFAVFAVLVTAQVSDGIDDAGVAVVAALHAGFWLAAALAALGAAAVFIGMQPPAGPGAPVASSSPPHTVRR